MRDVAERVKRLVVEQLAVDPNKVVVSAGFVTISTPTASTGLN